MIDLKSLDDNSLAEWSKTFAAKIKEHASVLGISETEVQSVGNDSTTVGKLVDTVNQAKETHADSSVVGELTKYKELIFNGPSDKLREAFPGVFTGLAAGATAGVLPRIMGLVDKIKGHPGLTPEMASSLGVDPSKLDQLKGGDKDVLGWFGNFKEKIKDFKPALGLSDSDVQSVDKDHEALNHVVNETEKAKTVAPDHPAIQDLNDYKEMVKSGPSSALSKAFPAAVPVLLAATPGVIPRFTQMIQNLMHKPGFNDTIGRSLGITEEKREPVAAQEPVREPVSAAAGRGPSAAVEEPRGAAKPVPWLVPLLIMGLLLLTLLALALWPRAPRVATQIPGVAPSAPAGVAAGPLAISKLQLIRGQKDATITWDTNRPTTGQIQYGKTPSYEMGTSPGTVSMEDRNLLKIHSLKLMGLDRGSTYYYRVISKDKSGNEVMSKTSSFQLP